MSRPNPWLDRRVLNYAHQGGAREGPSNTLYAMRRAVAAGAHALELDVHATADRHVVVCHDPTVDRTTNGTGRLSELTLDEVQQLDNAHWWVPGQVVDHSAADGAYPLRGRAPEDQDLRIPTLDEVLAAFPGTFINLDIKETAPTVEPYEDLVVQALAEHGRTDDVIVTSFADSAVETVAALAPGLSTAAGLGATAELYFAVRNGEEPPPTHHDAIQVPPTFQETTVVDKPLVDAAHKLEIAVHVWTIDEEEEMEALLDLEVDGIMSDRPSVLAEVLRARDVSFPGGGSSSS